MFRVSSTSEPVSSFPGSTGPVPCADAQSSHRPKPDVYATDESSVENMLEVLNGVKQSLKDMEIALSTGNDAVVLPESTVKEGIVKEGIVRLSGIIASIYDVLSDPKLCGKSSERRKLLDILSQKLGKCIAETHGMFILLKHLRKHPLYSCDPLSTSAETLLLSLARLTNTVHRLCSPVVTSSRDIAFFNTAARAVCVIVEAMRVLTTVVDEGMANKMQRCVTLIKEVSLLLSPYAPRGSEESLRVCCSGVVRTAVALVDEICDTNLRDPMLAPMAAGIQSVISRAADIYNRMVVFTRGTGTGRFTFVFYEDSDSSYMHDGIDMVLLGAELLERAMHASLFELRYQESIKTGSSLVPNEDLPYVEEHVKNLKLGLLYALVGACKWTNELSCGTADFLMDCINASTLASLSSLECVLRRIGTQTNQEGHPALRSLGSVAVLINRVLDQMHKNRELYSHNWDPDISGIALFPGELPRNRRVTETTATSALDALRTPFKVKKRFAASIKRIIRFIVRCIAGLFMGVYKCVESFCGLFSSRASNTGKNATLDDHDGSNTYGNDTQRTSYKEDFKSPICTHNKEDDLSENIEEKFEIESFVDLHAAFSPFATGVSHSSSLIESASLHGGSSGLVDKSKEINLCSVDDKQHTRPATTLCTPNSTEHAGESSKQL